MKKERGWGGGGVEKGIAQVFGRFLKKKKISDREL